MLTLKPQPPVDEEGTPIVPHEPTEPKDVQVQGTNDNTAIVIEADHEFTIVGRGHVFTCPEDLLPIPADELIEAEPFTYTLISTGFYHQDEEGWDGPIVHRIQKFKRSGRDMVAMLVTFPGW